METLHYELQQDSVLWSSDFFEWISSRMTSYKIIISTGMQCDVWLTDEPDAFQLQTYKFYQVHVPP